MKRLAIITTHPIQYHAPWFRLLSERKQIALKVFYTWSQSNEKVYDARFGAERSWDIPLLDGYEYEFVPNTSRYPDSNHFRGIINPGFIARLKQENFDAILVIRWNLWSHFFILQAFGKHPTLFFRGDSTWSDSGNIFKRLAKKLLLHFVYRRVSTAFIVGSLNKHYFLQCGLKESQLQLAPHAVDNERFQHAAAVHEKRAVLEREQLKIPTDSVVFVYAGKFYPIKQLDLLIRSFLRLQGAKYRLVLYGSGEQEILLRQLTGADERIIFQPFKNQSEMPWVYRLGDVFVLPSKRETWGLGVNEAMACGRPAIVSDGCGCAPELIVEGETGFTFRSGGEADLLKQMQQFTDKTVSKKMGEKAFEHIRQFSLEKVAEVIEEAVVG